MAQPRRMYRVAERLQEILASELVRCHDPRLELVTITAVKVSSDLRHAKVYWSVNGDDRRRAEVDAAFLKSTSHFRKVVGDQLDIRFVPELRFYYDDSFETGLKVEELFARIAQDRES